MSDMLVHDPLADHRFLGSRQVGEARWEVPVTPHLVSPSGGLYGGAGIAAAIAAMESVTGRPLRWVTVQFSSSAQVGDVLDVGVSVDTEGRRITQATAVAAVGDRVVVRAMAALGEARGDAPRGAWVTMPDVPEPEDCPASGFPVDTTDTFMETMERRRAEGPGWEDFLTHGARPAGFRICMWARTPGYDAGSPAMLSWLADMVPMAIAGGVGEPVGGTSLDNTLRMVERRRCEWVLLEVRPTATADGYGYGEAHLWAPDGTLLATASQTAIVRTWRLG